MNLLVSYERLLWGTMDALGVSRSLARKVMTAVGIQFGVSVAQAALPVLVAGRTRTALSAILFVGAFVAFANTVLVVRRDVVSPVERLSESAAAVAAGDLSTPPPEASGEDEIARLVSDFGDMHAHLRTVSKQATALADREFDDPVLDESLPGEFGDALDRMAADLASHTRNLRRLVDSFAEATERAAEGDLTARLPAETVGTDDERYAEVARSYNEFVGELSDTVAEVRSFAIEVAAMADEAQSHVERANEASEDVAAAVGEISDGATTQTDHLQTVAGELSTLSATVEEIAASADEVAGRVETAADRGRSGRDVAAEAMAELDAVESQIDETAAAVGGLAERIEEVDEIAAFIEDVGSQTDLLAVNAAIEAARAGEAGDGFGVVAEEVKALATETRDSAEEVSALVEDVTDRSEETLATVRETNRKVADSVETVESVIEEFETIVAAVEEVDSSVHEVSRATDQQASTSQDVAARVDDVANISEETAARSASATDAADRQAESVGELADRATGLSDRAAALESLVAQFELPDDAESRERVPAPADD